MAILRRPADHCANEWTSHLSNNAANAVVKSEIKEKTVVCETLS